jgi:hypothetical protein
MASLLDLPPEIIEMIIPYLQGPASLSAASQSSETRTYLVVRSSLASYLGVPPELMDLIVPYLRSLARPSAVMQSRWARRDRLISSQTLCGCFDDKMTKGQLLARAGQNLGVGGRDIVRFGTMHPYVEDCIKLFRCCEMVDAWNTSMGVVPAATTTIPFAVR